MRTFKWTVPEPKHDPDTLFPDASARHIEARRRFIQKRGRGWSIFVFGGGTGNLGVLILGLVMGLWYPSDMVRLIVLIGVVGLLSFVTYWAGSREIRRYTNPSNQSIDENGEPGLPTRK